MAISGYRHTYGDLAEVLKAAEPELKIIYENHADVMNWKIIPMDCENGMDGFLGRTLSNSWGLYMTGTAVIPEKRKESV